MAAPMKMTLNVCRRHLSLLRQLGRPAFCTAAPEPPAADFPSLSQLFREASSKQDGRRPIHATSEMQPANHNIHHEGLFFDVSEEDAPRYYQNFPSPRWMRMQKAFGQMSVMVRRPAVETMHYLKSANYDFPAIRYVLYGPLGCGKTLSLAHLLHYCASQGWVVAHVPWVALLNRHFGEVQMSSYRSGRVDLPKEAAQWLVYFKMQNAHLLKDMSLEYRYVWNKREAAEAGSPILEAIDFGLGRPKYATDVVGLIVKELKTKATAKKLRLLFAADGVNAMWQPTTIKREENILKKYDASELTLVHNFKKLLSNDWSNGAVVCTVDKNGQITDERQSDLPRYLLGEEGFAHLDPFVPIRVSEYSHKEVHSALSYLTDRRWIANPKAATDDGKKELIFLSQRNPFTLMDVSSSW